MQEDPRHIPVEPLVPTGAVGQRPSDFPVPPVMQATPSVPAKHAFPKWLAPLLAVLGVLILLGSFAAACSSITSSADRSYAPNTVAVISLDGTIDYDGTANSPTGFKELLDNAAKESNIKAIVLRVNSGGGVAAAGEEMATYLSQFEKPVVISSAATNASAAYMISSQADYIYVLKSTDIGAIGTILQHYDLSELYEKLGISIESIKSAESKDSSYTNRPLTNEERERYQRLIDSINDVFIDFVAQGRDMQVSEVKKLADGMTWAGVEAVEIGIADEVGTYDDACAKAAELAGLGSDYEVTDLGIYNASLSDYLRLLESSDTTPEDKLLAVLEEIAEHDGIVR